MASIKFDIIADNSSLLDAFKRSKVVVTEFSSAMENSIAQSSFASKLKSIFSQFQTQATQSLDTINEAFLEIDQIVDTNKEAIKELEAQYASLSSAVQSAKESGDTGAVGGLEQRKEAITAIIEMRQQIIAQASEVADKLAQEEKKFQALSEASSTSSKSIREQLQQIGEQCEKLDVEIADLEKEYNNLKQQASEAFMSGNDDEAGRINARIVGIKAEINERQQLRDKIRETSNALEESTTATEKAMQATAENATKHNILRQQLTAVRNEMAMLIANGQQNTEQYKNASTEAARLTRLLNNQSQSIRVASSNVASFQGVLSGLSGVTGVFTSLTGAMALCSGSSQELSQAMMSVRTVTAITIGLQQIQNALNANSAFRISTIGKLKEWWIGILEKERIAQQSLTTSTIAQSAATNAITVAATAGTTANVGLAGAFHLVGAAINPSLCLVG